RASAAARSPRWARSIRLLSSSRVILMEYTRPRGAGCRSGREMQAGLYMFITCLYALSMDKMIQIRNVPRELHATLKARAALAGTSFSDYRLAELRRVATRPGREEMQARLAGRAPVAPGEQPAAAVRAERDAR